MDENRTDTSWTFAPFWVRRPVRAFIDLLYPPVCADCGVTMGGHAGLCPACWGAVRFIERPFCEILGEPFSHDLGSGIVSAAAIANPPPFDRLRSAVIHDKAGRALVHALKYRDRTDLAPMMARWMMRAADGTTQDCDVIVPVPLHRTRLFTRKFNQAAELARHVSHLSGKPLLPDTLIRIKRTARQVGLGAKAREDNVRGAFAVRSEFQNEIFGRKVLLIDDVYTTGATTAAAARALRKSGAAHIGVLTFARAVAQTI
ncbi:ComF family protein [Oryzifoliimicrobium ureilyticus]|uniref:ComF family protein n=1 Tax=Oryzifoliimicrobium ureilyticus TaxID=3113724 RepID=UPI0030761ADB